MVLILGKLTESVGYHENGQIAGKCYYINGKLEGECARYYENGQLEEKSNYVNGSEIKRVIYDKNGQLKK
jgi:antitoxin component YwqK of YwqJK toxin-antitoxin module